jgi:hypothetical protein
LLESLGACCCVIRRHPAVVGFLYGENWQLQSPCSTAKYLK